MYLYIVFRSCECLLGLPRDLASETCGRTFRSNKRPKNSHLNPEAWKATTLIDCSGTGGNSWKELGLSSRQRQDREERKRVRKKKKTETARAGLPVHSTSSFYWRPPALSIFFLINHVIDLSGQTLISPTSPIFPFFYFPLFFLFPPTHTKYFCFSPTTRENLKQSQQHYTHTQSSEQ